jgi:hypothetical protein
VGFQAGVLQVWLDEAGITFDHADGASGGCFNLAMYCQGMTGRRIADNWRNLDPFLPVDVNIEEFWRLAQLPSLFTYDNFRRRVLPFWGIDWAAINRSGKLGTFNLFNFSKKRLEVVTQDRMDEDKLISAVSLPMWFPPVVIDGDRYIDAVYVSDANVEEAIRRGAEEIWAIWTVSTRDEWRNGFIAQYFHIIEAAAGANFFAIWNRIGESNARIAAGQAGEFGRHIELKLLHAEVPVHYLFNFSKDQMAESVNLGVNTAREWCEANGVALPRRGPDLRVPASSGAPVTALEFTEQMRGFGAAGATDFQDGFERGRKDAQPLRVKLTITMDNVDRFVTDPNHEARAEGFVESPVIGGWRPVHEGRFNLLVHGDDPRRKHMRYRLFFTDQSGSACTLVGYKDIRDDAGPDIWDDTTRLYTRILKGRVATVEEETAAGTIASGIVQIQFLDFLEQLTTFRASGPSPAAQLEALNRFGALFLGKLWEVYASEFVHFK